MNLDEITKRQNALIKDYCISCNKPLPPNAAFCEHCGPPIPPEDISESGTSFWQAMRKISLLTLVFAVLVAYKMDWDYQAFFGSLVETPMEEKAQDIPQDEDYHLVHYVNVSFANIREQPSKESKIIGGAGKGERLIILEQGEHWTQVDLGGKKGWVATRLLSSSIE
ncbi:MAG: SH3 domain-containing protein [Nitrospinota bacterium]|nr:SH3 domain-containing protein [Nitrospinota bacterium]